MTPEQRDRLKALLEKVADSMLLNLNPDHWPGAGKRAADMKREDRGDLAWVLKIPAQQLTILMQGERLLSMGEPAATPPGAPEPIPEEAYEEATKAAQAVLKKAKNSAPR